MAGQSQFHKNVLKLDRKLQRFLAKKPGYPGKMKSVKLALLKYLETGEKDPLLSRVVSRVYGGRSLLKKIGENVEYKHSIPQAIYDHQTCGTSIKKSCIRWKCRVSDVLDVKKLAKSLGRDLGSFSSKMKSSKVDWIADVESCHEEMVVHVSDRALEDMLLVTMEGYQVPQNRRNKFTEVYGICLGMVRDKRMSKKGQGKYFERHINVERAAVQIRARGTKVAVWPNRESLSVQLDIAESLFPHLEVIGDFHSHLYLRADKLLKQKGWGFSNDDYWDNKEWINEMRKRNHEPRVGFIIAIGKKKQSSNLSLKKSFFSNVKFIQINRFLIAVAAFRILHDGWYVEEGIELKIPSVCAT